MTGNIPESKLKDLSSLKTDVEQYRKLGETEKRKTFRGLDSETAKGDIFLICNSDGDYLDKITPDNLIRFLFNRNNQESTNFFYNLAFDGEVIIKAIFGKYLEFIPRHLLKSIKVNYRKNKYVYYDYTIKYIPQKSLSISKGKKSASYYDASQFWNQSLIAAYEEHIRLIPDEQKSFKGKRKYFTNRFYRHNKKVIRQYCINDSIYAKELMEKRTESFFNLLGFHIARWISPAYLSEKALIKKKVQLPLFDSLTHVQQEFIYACSFGGRFEMCKRANIGFTATYDVNSAYPETLRNLPDFTNGYWIQDKTIHPLAAVGFYEIECNIPEDVYIAPFPFMIEKKLVFPVGHFITRVTLPELQGCPNPNWYKILSSEQFIPKTDYKPFKKIIESLYAERQKLKRKGDSSEYILKIIMNSMYGKFGAFNKTNMTIGTMFFPPIFAAITGSTRAKLYEFAISNSLERDVVAFATDSITLTKKLDLPETKELGKFTLKEIASDTFYVQNGISRKDRTWKERGLGTIKGKRVNWHKTLLRNGIVYAMIKVLRNTRLKSAIKFKKTDSIGDLKETERELNLNADRGRFWESRITSTRMRTHNDSIPISMNHFTGNEGYDVEK